MGVLQFCVGAPGQFVEDGLSLFRRDVFPFYVRFDWVAANSGSRREVREDRLRGLPGPSGAEIAGAVVQPKCGRVIVRRPARSVRETSRPFSSMNASMRRVRPGELVP